MIAFQVLLALLLDLLLGETPRGLHRLGLPTAEQYQRFAYSLNAILEETDFA